MDLRRHPRVFRSWRVERLSVPVRSRTEKSPGQLKRQDARSAINRQPSRKQTKK
jgi:hypothetical protein